jgi:VCBS repeat-containing protein
MGLAFSGAAVRAATILDFNDVPPGTLSVFSPYQSQGFALVSTSGGWVFNSPDTGNGSPQPVGNNPFYAGENGFAAFAPATITLTQTDGAAFSLLSIDLARNFAFDPAPTVTFTGTLASGGTVTESFSVTTPSGAPSSFQTFSFTGFTDLASVSWDQAGPTAGLSQFGDIRLSAAVPEPSSLALASVGVLGCLLLAWRRRNSTDLRALHA